ncbi:AAA family ATPase [Glaciimonas sp. PAMC28666]|uniref:AAA family ATPase n=1 Tax=Glaciimonas sp. PAMC28666 TaxID=2807626 RepID=UPI0019638F3D|nr:AAA family ATPase [Glaciimonas sp. PAMC28666]QRX82290.1 AAA family ATPase [Glaciimonas sp. PAMC28666]
MYLKSIEIENYKCFWRSQKAVLEHGFNLFIGVNNSGKTTMLEGLELTSNVNQPHRSHKNLLTFGAQSDGDSRFTTTLSTDVNELRRVCGNDFYIPMPVPQGESFHSSIEGSQDLFLRLLADQRVTIGLESVGQIQSCSYETVVGKSPNSTRNTNGGHPVFALRLLYKDWSSSMPEPNLQNFSGLSLQIGTVREAFLPYIYRFSAQRRPSGESQNQGVAILDRDATNLPFCINHLQTNDADGHRILCKLVNRIFPSVKWVQAPPVPNTNFFRLQCLPVAPEGRRSDLAIQMSSMGSGIGNVIAMLYVVLTSRYPQVIAIDEPNSFLHPRALRELLQIFATEGAQHQYILTGHSADVLTAVNPNLITLFEFDGACTTIKQVNSKDIALLRSGLSDLGIRMTDLHGRDRVLWVEGQTEEIVLPDLLRHFCPELAAGIAVLRVEHTGAFEKRGIDPKEVANIYKRLTESSALVPPMVAILLDSELRSSAACAKLEADSNGALRFLKLTMLENYLLVPDAITAVLNDLKELVSLEQVTAALEIAKKNSEGGANILKQVFSSLSDARHEFKKTRDAPRIVSWILLNSPHELLELGNFLREIVGLNIKSSNEK